MQTSIGMIPLFPFLEFPFALDCPRAESGPSGPRDAMADPSLLGVAKKLHKFSLTTYNPNDMIYYIIYQIVFL